MDFLLVLLIIWLALPLGLIPAVIVLAVKNSKLRKMIAGESVQFTENIPSKERRPVSFTWILILGVLFVVVSGVLFSTSNWEYMSGAVKTLLMISMSVVFFGACAVSEKRFGLEKTGFAFFMLGGIFLPVSVTGMAYFKVFGEWFSFDSDGHYAIYLVMLALTLAVMTFSGVHYRDSKISRYIFSFAAASEYAGFVCAVSERIYGESSDNMILKTVMFAAGYLVFAFVPAVRSVPAQFGMTAALAVCSVGGYAVPASLALVCILISVLVNRKAYSSTAMLAFPFVLFNLVKVSLEKYSGYSSYDFAVIALTMAILGIVSMIAGLMYSGRNSEGKGVIRTDAFPDFSLKMKWFERITGFAVFVLLFFGFDELSYGFEDIYTFYFGMITALYFAVRAVTLKISGKECECSHALMFACVTVSFALFSLTPADIIEGEYYTAVSFVSTVPLLFIWKKHRTLAENIVFVHSVLAAVLLMFSAHDSGELINAVILAGAASLGIVFSFIRRAKKWFVFASVTALVIVLQLTEEVWTSVSWWVYLLAVGLIFIIYAAVNEYCRKKGQANPVKSGIRNVIDRVWNKC